MMMMDAFSFDKFVAQTKQGTQFLIGLNRLSIDQAQLCVNFTPVKIKIKEK